MGEAEANKRIAQWKQGTILNLSNLGLTSLQNFTLPTTLTTLYCYNNQLTSLPTLPTTLRTLHCSYNRLTSLPTLPSTLTNLYYINNPFSFETPRSDNETPHEYWNRLEVVQSRKRTIKRNRDIKEELMMVCWHPSKVQKMLDLYGIDYEDYV